MSKPLVDDLFVVQRGDQKHEVAFADLGDLLDDDLVVAQRGDTHHKVTGAHLKAWVTNDPSLWPAPDWNIGWSQFQGFSWSPETMQRGVTLHAVSSFSAPVPAPELKFRFALYGGSGQKDLLARGPLTPLSSGSAVMTLRVPADLPVGSQVTLYLEAPDLPGRVMCGTIYTVAERRRVSTPGNRIDDSVVLTIKSTSGSVVNTLVKGVAATFVISDVSGAVMQSGETWEWFLHEGPRNTDGFYLADGAGSVSPGSMGDQALQAYWTPPMDYEGPDVVVRIYKADEGWKDLGPFPVVDTAPAP
jgi:hypothetical protein